MIIVNCEQRSEEWFHHKIGTISASNAENLVKFDKRSKKYVSLDKYKINAAVNKILCELALEGQEPFVMTDPVKRGMEMERFAREDYERLKNVKVNEVGFIYKDDSLLVGCSPDGLVGDDGSVEIKCPNSKTHLEYLRLGPPDKYVNQMQFQMLNQDNIKWCDFVSWDDRIINPKLIMYVKRIYRDSEMIEQMEKNIEIIKGEVLEFLNKHELEWVRFGKKYLDLGHCTMI